jgi:hypothetical protein
MQTSARLLATAFIFVLLVAPASAQESRFSVAVKGGASIEDSEDNLTGTKPALGATFSFSFNRWWRGEAEFWLPACLEDERGRPKHRDILFSFAAVRTFGEGAARPFVVAGMSISRTQDWFRFCFADRVLDPGTPPVRAAVSCDDPDVIERREERHTGTDGYALVGGGVEFAIARRVNLVADVRVSLAPASVIVRPAVGVAIGF